MKQLWLQIT